MSTLILVIGLPLIIGGIYTAKMIGSRAYLPTTAPVTPAKTPIATSVPIAYFSTNWATFTAQNFSIHTPDGTEQGKYFKAVPSRPCNTSTGEMFCIHSNSPSLNSQGLHYMSLEVQWFENNLEMRMFIYLYSDGNKWWSDEIRVYNGQPNSNWVFFKGKFFESPIGQAYIQNGQFRLDVADPNYGNAPVTLSFSNLTFNAFTNYFTKSTPKPQKLADLLISGPIAVNPNLVKVNEPVLVSFKMTNVGLSPARPATYSYTKQSDGLSEIAPSNTCHGSTSLKSGESCTSAYLFRFNSIGVKTLTIKLDPDNSIKEANENNNNYSTTVIVSNTIKTPQPRTCRIKFMRWCLRWN